MKDYQSVGIKKAPLFRCFGDPAGIRTRDPRLKRPLLYQLSYRIKIEGAKIENI